MECADVEALAGAFATETLSEYERASVLAHLADCAGVHEEFAEARAVSFVIAGAAPELEPPAGLRERVLARLEAGPGVPPRPERPAPSGGRSASRTGATTRTRWLAAVAVAALVFLAGAGIGSLITGRDSAARTQMVTDSRSGAWLEVTTAAGGSTVTLGGLPELDAATAYQVWTVQDGNVLSLAVIEANAPGPWSIGGLRSIAADDRLAVTVGPSGGAGEPQGELILASGGA